MPAVIEVEADTLEEARVLASTRLPAGAEMLRETILETGEPRTSTAHAATVEAALENAKKNVPADSSVLQEELTPPEHATLELRARDEEDARQRARSQLRGKATIERVTVVSPARSGFLGFGAKMATYQISVRKAAQAAVQYRAKARVKISYRTRAELLKAGEPPRADNPRQACCVCGKTKASIGRQILEMQRMGVVVINHDLIAFCPRCGLTFCSNHYTLNGMVGTHRCNTCGDDMQVDLTDYTTS